MVTTCRKHGEPVNDGDEIKPVASGPSLVGQCWTTDSKPDHKLCGCNWDVQGRILGFELVDQPFRLRIWMQRTLRSYNVGNGKISMKSLSLADIVDAVHHLQFCPGFSWIC